MLVTLRKLVESLQRLPQNMRRNMEITVETHASQNVFPTLTSRRASIAKRPYEAVQRRHEDMERRRQLRKNLAAESTVRAP